MTQKKNRINRKNTKRHSLISLCQYFSRLKNTKSAKDKNFQDPRYFNIYVRCHRHRFRVANEKLRVLQFRVKVPKNNQSTYQDANIRDEFEQNEQHKMDIQKQGKLIQNSSIGIKNNQINLQNAMALGLVEPITRGLSYKPNFINNSRQFKIYENIASLYDRYIYFLISRCVKVNQKVPSLTRIWYENPCLLIYPDFQKLFQGLQQKIQPQQDRQFIKKSFMNNKNNICKIFMCMFIALCIIKAKKKRMPFQVVIRSSFGHLLPSVAEIGESFRFSPGVVPDEYLQQVIAPALHETQETLLSLLMHSLKDINIIESYLTKFNVKILQNHKQYGFLLTLTSKCQDSYLLDQFFKQNYYADYIVNKIVLNFTQIKDFLSSTILAIDQIIQKIGSESFTSIKEQILKFKKIEIRQNPSKKRQYSQQFRELVVQILKRLQDPLIKSQQLTNNEQLTKSIIPKFHRRAQQALKKLIQKYSQTKNPDDNTSLHNYSKDSSMVSSEYVHHRKVIVSGGMAAITLSILATGSLIKQLPIKVNVDCVYYQTHYFFKVFNDYEKSNEDSDIVLRYLNYFQQKKPEGTIGKSMKLQQINQKHPNVKMIILDITSSPTKQIIDAVVFFFKEVKEGRLKSLIAIITVSSGLKVSQMGCDMASWGQIRIFDFCQVPNKNKAQQIQNKINLLLTEQHPLLSSYIIPKQTEIIRKLFKQLGTTLSIKKLFDNNQIQPQLKTKLEIALIGSDQNNQIPNRQMSTPLPSIMSSKCSKKEDNVPRMQSS